MNEQLLKFAGAWKGGDLDELLKIVHETRSDIMEDLPPEFGKIFNDNFWDLLA